MSRVILSETRDIPLLIYIWQWKCVTSSALHTRFFAPAHPLITYKRLTKLRRAGYLEVRPDFEGVKWGWILTQKGFRTIHEYLPPLRELGYAPHDIRHDLLVSGIHQGEWFREVPEGASLLTEQEISRVSLDQFPSLVPRNDRHIPDGYWHFGSKLVALEVELTRKRMSEYSRIGHFYASYPAIESVVWVVPGKTLASSILERLTEVAREKSAAHRFFSLNSVLKFGWQATQIAGVQMGPSINETLGKKLVNGWANFTTHPCFEFRKSPYFPSSSHSALTTVRSHSVDIRPHK